MNADSATDSPLTPSAAEPSACGGKESESEGGGAANTTSTKNTTEIASSLTTMSTRAQDDEARNPSPTTAPAPEAVSMIATSPIPYNHGDALTHLVLGGDHHEDDVNSPGADDGYRRCAEYYGGTAAEGDPYATDDDSSEDGEIVFRAKKTTSAMEICTTPPPTTSGATAAMMVGSGGSSGSRSGSSSGSNSSKRSDNGGSAGKKTPPSATGKETPSSATSTTKKTPSSNTSKKTRAERLAAVTKGRQRFSGTKSLKKILGRISPGGSNNGNSGAKGSPPKPTGSPSNSNDVPVVPPSASADGSPSPSSPRASPSALAVVESNPSMQSCASESRASSSPGSVSTSSPPKSFPEDDIATSGAAILDATTSTPTATPIAIKATPEVDESVTKYFSSLIKSGKDGKGGTSRKKSRSPPASGSRSPTEEGKDLEQKVQEDTIQAEVTVTPAAAANTSTDENFVVPSSPCVSEDVDSSNLPAVVSSPPSAHVVAAPVEESSPLTSELNDNPPFAVEITEPNGVEAKIPQNLASTEPAVTVEREADEQEPIEEEQEVKEERDGDRGNEVPLSPCPPPTDNDARVDTSVCVPTRTPDAEEETTVEAPPAADIPSEDPMPTSSTTVLETPLIISPSEELTETVEESPEESPLVTPVEAETARPDQPPPAILSLKEKSPSPDNEMGEYFDSLPSREDNSDTYVNKNKTSTGTTSLTKSSSAPRIGVDGTSTEGGESTKQVDLLSGLSTKYSPSQHMPKYSETELKAKIDAALLKAEREWTQKVKLEGSGNEAAHKRFDDLKNEHESEMKRIAREHDEKMEDQRRVFEKKTNEILSGGTLEQLQQTVKSLKNQVEEDKARFRSDLEKQREAHEADIKDLEEMVNDIDADNGKKLMELREKLTTKETMVESLGKSLKEAQEKKAELESRFEKNQEDIDQLRIQMEEDRKVATSLEEKMEREKADHEARLRNEEAKRTAECDKVRNQMIERAEVQFAKANEEYKRIKSNYSASMKSVKQLESDLKEAKSHSDSLAQEQQLKEKKMLAEVAELESKLATAEAKTASVAKKYTMEIAEMKEQERKLSIELENAARDREAANASQSTIIAEKERLKKDNKDLNEMCEQLLAMAEQGTK